MKNLNQNLEREILAICNRALNLFRYQPKPEFIASIAIKMAEDQYSPEMVQFIFDQAVRLHDQYPSLAQMIEIATSFRVRERFSPKALTQPQEQQESPRKTPWPILLEVYMENLRKPLILNGNVFLRRLIALSDAELDELYFFYYSADFENPRAKEIIGNRWGKTSSEEVQEIVANIHPAKDP